MPVKTGTLDFCSPKHCTTNFMAIGSPMLMLKSTVAAIGMILNVYVNYSGSSISRYRAKLPEIVSTTTRVHMIQNGP